MKGATPMFNIRERVAGGIVGVEGGEYHMAGLGSFNGDVGGFQVANLTHHDDVGVLPQKGFQCGGKGHALFVVYVYLIDAGQINLGGVFRSGNIDALGIENVQTGIERNGFTGAGGAGNQYHAVGAVNGFEQQFFLERFETELFDIQRGRVRIQDTHHDFFTEQRRQGIDTEINRPLFFC